MATNPFVGGIFGNSSTSGGTSGTNALNTYNMTATSTTTNIASALGQTMTTAQLNAQLYGQYQYATTHTQPMFNITTRLEVGWRYVQWEFDEYDDRAYAKCYPIIGLDDYKNYVVAGASVGQMSNRRQFLTVLMPNDTYDEITWNERAQKAFERDKAADVAAQLSGLTLKKATR